MCFYCIDMVGSKVKSENTKDSKLKIKQEKGPSLNAIRENADESFKDVIKKVGINEFYTKLDSKQRYNKFITAVVPEADFNYMSDLIEMPTTDKGFKWLLTVVDLALNTFDMEPMKNKEAKTTLEAFQRIIKRGILKLPEISLKTDNGSEFKGVFNKFLEEKGIFHKYSRPYRHQQQSPIEGLNKTLARVLMTYLNDKSVEINEDYHNWTDILDVVREEVNAYRKRDLDKLKEYQNNYYFNPNVAGEPEFNIGDYVVWKLDKPVDILGNSISDDNRFRAGDRMMSIESRQIVDILCYPSKPFYRYKLHDMPHVSYSASELKLSEKQGDFYTVKRVLNKEIDDDGQVWYLVWFQGDLKSEAQWIEKEQLIEDGVQDAIADYEASVAQQQKQKKKAMSRKKKSTKR